MTKAKLEACWPQAMRLDADAKDYLAPHVMMVEDHRSGAPPNSTSFIFIIDYLSYPIL